MTYGNYPNLDGVKKVLVIKLRHLGDVLLSTPVFSALRQRLADACIDALVYEESMPMLEGHPAIHKVIGVRRGKGELKRLWQLRKQRYDLVINLTEGDRGALIALLSGARVRIGIDPQGGGFLGKRHAFTHLVKPCPTVRHAVERDLDALRRIGIFPSLESRSIFLHIPHEAKERMHDRLKTLGLAPQSFILLHPISRWRFKCPPPSLFAAAMRHLPDVPFLLTSGKDPVEKDYIGELKRLFPSALSLAGETTLKELSALIQMSKLLVTVDSVPLHMASALQTPVLALFGPSSEGKWGPWMHPKAKVFTKPLSCRPCGLDGCGGSKMADCLYTLSAEALAQEMVDLMSQRENSSPR